MSPCETGSRRTGVFITGWKGSPREVELQVVRSYTESGKVRQQRRAQGRSVAKVSTAQTSCAQDSQRSLLNVGSDSAGLGRSLQFCISNRFSGDVIGDRSPNTLCTARV